MSGIIDRNFRYHAPKGNQAARYEELRAKAKEFAQLVADECPECRERQLALENIEMACMWANAGIARNE
ncbi:MAG: hypothetical protein JRC86_05985 [Deltaproteobacteria bacterium]|nr:hypothetical protein [Deltaproteobacteria bacterium]